MDQANGSGIPSQQHQQAPPASFQQNNQVFWVEICIMIHLDFQGSRGPQRFRRFTVWWRWRGKNWLFIFYIIFSFRICSLSQMAAAVAAAPAVMSADHLLLRYFYSFGNFYIIYSHCHHYRPLSKSWAKETCLQKLLPPPPPPPRPFQFPRYIIMSAMSFHSF